MKLHRWLMVFPLAGLVAASTAGAGQNAAARARLYWQAGSACVAGRNSTSDSVVQVVVTVRGVHTFRGAELQLSLRGAGGLPRAWQAHRGGAAESCGVFLPGGFPVAGHPNLYTTGARVPNLLRGANAMFYQFRKNPCLTPDSTGLVWYQGAGAMGVPRDSSLEYVLYAFRVDLRAARAHTAAAGVAAGAADRAGVCVYANYHFPCNTQQPPATLTLLDSDNKLDAVPFEPGYDRLTWKGGVCPQVQAPGPPRAPRK
ncbi:MAG TPA: hypothetical protein VMS93_10060 [Candidatus Saccharimonadales bacterium]|nr:hypothetical protein [Candidatus Saccharimonadales bacterium]